MEYNWRAENGNQTLVGKKAAILGKFSNESALKSLLHEMSFDTEVISQQDAMHEFGNYTGKN